MNGEQSTMSREKEQKRQETNHLEWRDYFAIAIASLETTLLPIIVSMIVLLLVVLLLRR